MTSGTAHHGAGIPSALGRLERRRVLMTVDAAGGVWDYALQLAQALAPHGIDIVLASMGTLPSAQQRAALQPLSNVVLCESEYKLEWMDDPWREVDAAGAWLLQLESYVCPSIIHLNGYCHAALPWTAPVLVVGHSCVYSWFAAVRRRTPGSEWHEYKRRVTAGLRAAALVSAPSETMLAALHAHYGAFNSGGAVYNGCEPMDFPPGEKQAMVFTAGRLWDEGKNIQALARLPGPLPWPIYAAGDDKSPDGRAIRLDGLTLLGRLSRPDMAHWLSRAAIFALPARYEPFGLAALEAALAGCVLILGDIPSLREIWRDAALFVPPDQTDALSATLTQALRHPHLRSVMSGRARQRAQAFSVQRMARGYLDLYRRLGAGKDLQSSRSKVQG